MTSQSKNDSPSEARIGANVNTVTNSIGETDHRKPEGRLPRAVRRAAARRTGWAASPLRCHTLMACGVEADADISCAFATFSRSACIASRAALASPGRDRLGGPLVQRGRESVVVGRRGDRHGSVELVVEDRQFFGPVVLYRSAVIRDLRPGVVTLPGNMMSKLSGSIIILTTSQAASFFFEDWKIE